MIANKLLWSKKKEGTVAYLGTFVDNFIFKTVFDRLYDVREIKAISENVWCDDVSCLYEVREGYKKKVWQPIKAMPVIYTPNKLYDKSVVKHVDLSVLTNEKGVYSYYMRMGVPVYVEDALYFKKHYRLNEVEVVRPNDMVLYINVLDKFCRKLCRTTEYGLTVALEQGIGLMTDDTTIYTINTLLVLFESDKQRLAFNKLVKQELAVDLEVNCSQAVLSC